MSIKIEVDISGTLKDLRGLAARVKNPKLYGLWKRLMNLLFKSWIAETFRKEGARRGHAKWKRLSPKYLRWKTTSHKGRGGNTYGPYSAKPLIKYGHLQASFKLLREQKSSMFFGTNIPYAKHHQDPKIPGRPPK